MSQGSGHASCFSDPVRRQWESAVCGYSLTSIFANKHVRLLGVVAQAAIPARP